MYSQRYWIMVSVLLAVIFVDSYAAEGTSRFSLLETGPYFLGYGNEPIMSTGGELFTSLFRLADTSLGGLYARTVPLEKASIGRRLAEWGSVQVPVAMLAYLGQHEINGHGGRAREFGVSAQYGLMFGGAYTELEELPDSYEKLLTLVCGGSESTSVWSRDLLLKLYSPYPQEPWAAWVSALGGTDFLFYVLSVEDPSDDPDKFQDQYEEGNDYTFYLIADQAWRTNADMQTVWDGDYQFQKNDHYLNKLYDLLVETAYWAGINPYMWTATVAFFSDWIADGDPIQPFMLPLGPLKLTLGTRGYPEISKVTRYADIYLWHERFFLNLYVRDIRSVIDRSYGYGFELAHCKIAPNLFLSAQLDAWQLPKDTPRVPDTTYTNASCGISWIHTPVGFSLRYGYKDAGWLPGLPVDEGSYLTGGLLFSFPLKRK